METADFGELGAKGAAAALFAAVFLIGGRLRAPPLLAPDRRSVLSFGAGMSSAYVFVRLMPELHGARVAFVEATTLSLRHQGMAIYFVALLGFLVFYGLEHLRKRARQREAAGHGARGDAFRLHIGGFAAYTALVAYLLVRNLEESGMSTALYAVAIGFHFLSVDHSLREEHGEAYERRGRFLLAAAVAAGWVTAVFVRAPKDLLAVALAFVSGAVIMNSAVMELPEERDGRFVPFLAGGVLYGLLLIPLG
jgi:hypothetical protein